MRLISIAVTSILVGLSMHSLASPAVPQYVVEQKISLDAPGKWDYTALDPVRHRLYLTRGDHVQVLEMPSGKQIAIIPNTLGVHGVTFAEDLKIGFTSNGASNSITVFDLETMKVKQEVKVSGGNPDAILYEAASHKLFTFNGKTDNVTVIDARTLEVVATIKATGRPEFAVSDGAGKIYFNIEDHAGINVIDVASNTIVSRWVLKGCDEPSGLAMDVAHGRLFSSCQNKILAVTDAKNGKRIADVAIGEHPDAAAFDADTGVILTSNGGAGGTLSVLHEDDADHYSVLANVKTADRAKTMAVDMVAKKVYLPALLDGKFTIVVVGIH